MTSSPNITEALIRQAAAPESFTRGREYYQHGAVLSVMLRGDQLLAEIKGSSYEPYQVSVTLDAGGIKSAECTCPYDWGGVCKHIVAALLAYVHDPGKVEERPTLQTLLADLSAEQLRDIIATLAEQQPGLADLVESRVISLPAKQAGAQAQASTSGSPTPKERHTPIEPAPFRRQVRAVLHSLDRMSGSQAYGYVGAVVDSVRKVAEQALPFIEAGDGRNAMVVLEAVTEEYVAEWSELDDSDGELGDLFEELGDLWTEAILTADLTSAERETWAKRMSKWQSEVDDYGIEEAFQSAEAAAIQGWDHPPLLAILRGEITTRETTKEEGEYEDEDDEDYAGDEEDEEDEEDEDDEDEEDETWYADSLTQARLNVLERQGRTQEYLNLARAERQTDRYVTMLVKLGRVQEATDYGLRYLSTAHESMVVAQALREQGAIEDAMRIAEHGLTLDGQHATLARWLRDIAQGLGQTERALEAALAVMREEPGLGDYRAVQSLAGERWPTLREELLTSLLDKSLHSYYPRSHVEIFLHEGLIDDAIAAVKDASHELVELVADAAVQSRPDWVIEACRKQWSWIIEQGKSQHYGAAARWLEKAGQASIAAGREAEWRAEVEGLIAQHKRKYSLVPLLQNLLRQRRV